jgi:hypothetical protein
LLAVLLVVGLIALLGGDDDEDEASSGSTDTAQTQEAPARAGATGQDGGRLTGDGQPMLPVPADGLGRFEGTRAEGNAVVVQSVVGDSGFWVGTSEQDRVYVEYGGDVGEKEGGAPFQAREGEPVNLPCARPRATRRTCSSSVRRTRSSCASRAPTSTRIASRRPPSRHTPEQPGRAP